MKKTPALFLDRDGVINKDLNYLYKISDFKFLDAVFDCCKYFKHRGYKIVIITNQAGIARGYYTLEQFNKLTKWMLLQFEKNDISIDGVYFCPHHPDGLIQEYSKKCDCRKPEPGMLLQAMQELHLDMKMSILIGDKVSDVQAGINAGVGTNILVKTGKELDLNKAVIADQVVDSLVALLP